MDTFSEEKRRNIMRSIKGANTAPELAVRRYLFKHGFRFSLHRKDLPGKPDIVLRKYKTVIFVHGCFWHGHQGCLKGRLPKTNVEFWSEKIQRNQTRDKTNINDLVKLGWKVIVIYQCELKNKTIDKTMSAVIKQLEKT